MILRADENNSNEEDEESMEVEITLDLSQRSRRESKIWKYVTYTLLVCLFFATVIVINLKPVILPTKTYTDCFAVLKNGKDNGIYVLNLNRKMTK